MQPSPSSASQAVDVEWVLSMKCSFKIWNRWLRFSHYHFRRNWDEFGRKWIWFRYYLGNCWIRLPANSLVVDNFLFFYDNISLLLTIEFLGELFLNSWYEILTVHRTESCSNTIQTFNIIHKFWYCLIFSSRTFFCRSHW